MPLVEIRKAVREISSRAAGGPGDQGACRSKPTSTPGNSSLEWEKGPRHMPPASSASVPPSQPPSSWFALLGRGRGRPPTVAHSSRATQPIARPAPDTTPDAVRKAFWDCYRHLFPQSAIALQTETGALAITWPMKGDPHARHPFAAPVMLRFEPDLLDLMRGASPEQRRRIAAQQEQVLKAGLVGYDPYAAVPKARIIVLG